MTKLARTVKTELTRDEVVKLLELYNSVDTFVDDTMECLDVRLSQLSDLQSNAYNLRYIFDFRNPMNDCGHPAHWKPSVLPDDPTAWYHDSEENV